MCLLFFSPSLTLSSLTLPSLTLPLLTLPSFPFGTGMRASLDAGLQTAFDLLGEMIKGNQHTLEMVDAALGDNSNFRRYVSA